MNILEFKPQENEQDINSAKEFTELVASGDVTHAVICYRKKDGDVCYRLINPEHLTFLIGMLARVSFALQKDAL